MLEGDLPYTNSGSDTFRGHTPAYTSGFRTTRTTLKKKIARGRVAEISILDKYHIEQILIGNETSAPMSTFCSNT